MQNQNLQKAMMALLKNLPTNTPLLLHSCCGPCSTSVLETLLPHFCVTLLYANSNIWPKEEYTRRRDEQKAVLSKMPNDGKIKFIEEPYVHEDFLAYAKGLENEPEGGARCTECFRLRLGQAAKVAKAQNIEWIGTTLSVSPHKNSALIYQIGCEVAQEYGVKYLPSDFKKADGYKRSLQLSTEYELYRQSYCGCEFGITKQYTP